MSQQEISLNVKDGNLDRIISYVASIYGHPRDTIEQYVENSRDAYVSSEEINGLIIVQLFRKGSHPKIIITDHAGGMNSEKMKRLPGEITSSEKIGKALTQGGQRGQKAIGVLSFFQFSGLCEIESKQKNESFWHKLTLGKNKETGLFSNAIYEDEFAKGIDSSGTVVSISKISPEILNQITYTKIYNHLQEKFGDDIQSGKIRIMLSEDNKQGRFIDPEDISQGIPYPLPEKRTEHGFISFNLFLWPKSSGRRTVGVKTAGGLKILDDIALDTNFEGFPWNSNQVHGFITYDHLRTTPAKNRIYDDGKYYRIFVKNIKDIEERLAEEVRQFQDQEQEKKRQEAENLVSQIFKEVLKELALDDNPFKTPSSSNHGDDTLTGFEDGNKRIPGGIKNNTEDGNRNPTRPVVIKNDDGEKRRIKYISLPNLQFKPFEGDTRNLHSFRDEIESTIYCNDIHKDYLEAKRSGEATLVEYLLLIAAKETVVFENKLESPMKIAEEMIKVMSIVNRKRIQIQKKNL